MKRQIITERIKNIRSFTILFFCVTSIIWLLLLVLKLHFFGFDINELLDEIVSNILEILPPIIIFDFAYEYFTRRYESDEISEKIADTIMGCSDIMSRFQEEQKIDFIRSTVKTMVSPETAEMTSAIIYPYITNSYNIRTFYKYSIILRDNMESTLFSGKKYIKVYENIRFTKRYINHEELNQEIKVAFINVNQKLDDALRNQKYLFMENLSIADEELKKIIEKERDERKRLIEEEMLFTVYIDNVKVEIKDVEATEEAIIIVLQLGNTNECLKTVKSKNLGNTRNGEGGRKEHSIEISFAMPQIKGRSELLVSLNEPTYAPIIELSYPETIMEVKAYSFLNNGSDSSVARATHTIGTYEFCIQNEWIYPVSGVFFVINSPIQGVKESSDEIVES